MKSSATPEEEQDFVIAWYKRYDYLKNYFCVEENNTFIWYAAFAQNWADLSQANHNFLLWPVYIHPDFRKKWYAKLLLEKIIDHIWEQYDFPLYNIQLLVNADSLWAIALYKSLWFQVIGEYSNYSHLKNGTYKNVFIMEKSFMR